jgi:predicted PurR-regulated permease PerM
MNMMNGEINNQLTTSAQENLEAVDKSQATTQNTKKYLIAGILVAIVLIVLIVLATIYLVDETHQQRTEQIRDVFIIFLALQSLVIGIAMVVLIVQLSSLINLLQNELRPIINSTSETVNTLKGTAKFMSDNLAEPVIKLNQYAAMLKRIFKPSKN